MNWRETSFVTVFTVVFLAALKVLLLASVEMYGAWIVAPIVAAVGLGFGWLANYFNRGSETILHQSQLESRLDGEQEQLGLLPPVLALPPPAPEPPTFPALRE
jgi:hypothetical protein